jgi:hypothetical protein
VIAAERIARKLRAGAAAGKDAAVGPRHGLIANIRQQRGLGPANDLHLRFMIFSWRKSILETG